MKAHFNKVQIIAEYSVEQAERVTNLFLTSNEMLGAELISIQHQVTHSPATDYSESCILFTVLVTYRKDREV